MTATQPTTDELYAWLKLNMTPGLGSAQALLLLSEFGLPQHILNQSNQSLKRFLENDVVIALKSAFDEHTENIIQQSLQWVQTDDQHILTIADPLYPKSFFKLHDPPLLIYAKGKLELLQKPSVAIVGARNCTMLGAENAHEFARFLSTRQWCVVSGLATGIDTAAHKGALAAPQPNGSTIAVLATGMDIVYPAANRALAHKIAAYGLLISEFTLTTRARPYHFPKRNRLVAALSQGVLVVEAAQRSGSLITARLATEIGREVFAIPGSIHEPLSRGCHALIRQGAKLVESGNDILEELNQPTLAPTPKTQPPQKLQTTLSKADTQLLKRMGFEPISFDQLMHHLKTDTAHLSAKLSALELSGHVTRLPNGLYQQVPIENNK